MESFQDLCLVKLSARGVAVLSALSLTALTITARPTSAQVIPGIEGTFDSSLFSQDLTDAVTEGFRQRDRVFFEEGTVQFEQIVNDLQEGEQPEPILRIEPVSDDWQQFERRAERD